MAGGMPLRLAGWRRALHRRQLGEKGRRGVWVGTYQHRDRTESVSLSRRHPVSHEGPLLLLLLHGTQARLLAPGSDPRTSCPASWGGLRACKTGASSCLWMSSSWALFSDSGSAPCLWQQPYYYVYAWVLVGSDARSSWSKCSGALDQTKAWFVSLHRLRVVSLSLAVPVCRKGESRLDCAARSRLVLTDAA